jgi:soluble lytic murein transglycosylase-like protein
MAQVKSALAASAGTPFWSDQPSIILPAPLLDALAWEESGWQSTIIACDGGIGTMQIMPATATWMNQRFGTNWNVNTLSGNTNLGAEYVEWLVRYFGDVYYNGNYSLSNQDLLNDIIAAYNAGPAAIDPTTGPAGIPNWQYVNNVEALMTSCPCLSF